MSAPAGGRPPTQRGPGRGGHRNPGRPIPSAAPPAFRRGPGASATGSAAANTALPQAPQHDAARTRRPRGAAPPHIAVGFARPFRGLSPLPPLLSAPKPLPPDWTWLPESASCVACVPPCWPLRPVPSDVERGEGGGSLARASRRSRYVTRRLAPGRGGGAAVERPGPGQARRASAAPSLPAPRSPCCGNWKSLGPEGSREADQRTGGLERALVVKRD